jgi:hypothetical protein
MESAVDDYSVQQGLLLQSLWAHSSSLLGMWAT